MSITEITGLSHADVPDKWKLAPAFVPKGRYLDAEFLELEIQHLFPKTWLNACRVDEVERVGDYVDFEIAGQSIVVVRSDEGLKAYYNACRHRGTRIVRGQGRVGELKCPFHGWRWHLDGSLKYQADAENFDPRPARELCLPECQVGTWGGWVFINMDPNAESLEEYLDPLPTRLAGLRLEEMRIAWYKSVILPANWKTALDAFIESWHVPGTHPQLLRQDRRATPVTIAESEKFVKTYNELFRYHSRHADFVRYGPDSDPLALRQSYGMAPGNMYGIVDYALKELRTLFLRTDLLAAAELRARDSSSDPITAETYAELREKHARAIGIDYPSLSTEQLKKAMYDWHIFPNTVFLVDMGSALAYRARPNGLDPDSCIFDVQGLESPSAAGVDTAKPQFFEDWHDADVGAVLEQDFSNLGDVTIGMHSNSYDGHHLNKLQEMTIWNYHRAIDEFVFGATPQGGMGLTG